MKRAFGWCSAWPRAPAKLDGSNRRQEVPDQVPVPSIASLTGARILEWLELQSPRGESCGASVLEEVFAIGAHQMRHRVPLPRVAVQPEAALHGVEYPIAAAHELAPRWDVSAQRVGWRVRHLPECYH